MSETYAIIVEVRRLFHTLTGLADRVHRDLGITASQRAVLEALATSPGETVPSIARAKGVTRQHIQGLVNQLLEGGLVEQKDNPAHKRSPILNLTPAGLECFEEARTREARLLRGAARKLHEYDLADVADCLREMNAYFQTIETAQNAGRTRSS